VALTRDGADRRGIERTRDARTAWTRAERDDHLAVLWFVAGAEGLPSRLLQECLAMDRLVENDFYREMCWLAEARGEVRGKTKGILAVFKARGIAVSDAVRERILGCTDLPTLDVWIQRAAIASTAAAVVRAKPPPRARASRPTARAAKS
jgi:hypothetical protein